MEAMYTIKNREELTIPILIHVPKKSRGLVVISHGLGGFKEQPKIKLFAEIFYEAGFCVLRYDASHTLGAGGGKMEDATPTNYLHDLEDVIQWARNQKFWQENLILCGHSLGALSAILYAEKYPREVCALAPFSPVVSWNTYKKTQGKAKLAAWKTQGYREDVSNSKPGVIRRLNWNFVEDFTRHAYTSMSRATQLTMPTLILIGERDATTPLVYTKKLFAKIVGPKELHIIKGAEHTFRKNNLPTVSKYLKKWITNYL